MVNKANIQAEGHCFCIVMLSLTLRFAPTDWVFMFDNTPVVPLGSYLCKVLCKVFGEN